ncbi:hypothetical protein P3T23_000427 [Paraburkholderia sp. GAS448]
MKRKASRIDDPKIEHDSFVPPPARIQTGLLFHKDAMTDRADYLPDAICAPAIVTVSLTRSVCCRSRLLTAKTITGVIMDNPIRSYRGLEIYPLVYPHQPRGDDGSRHYDNGFDAAVRICRRGDNDTLTASRVFRVSSPVPFRAAGEARRASASYAERVIDGQIAGQSIVGL